MKRGYWTVTVACAGFIALFSGTVLAGPSVFQKMDGKEPDGKITAEELNACRANWFAALDADEDGLVVQEEFHSQFAEMDGEDADGAIDEAEFAAFFVGPENVEQYIKAEAKAHPETAFLIGTMDQDGDSLVTVEEFIPVVKARFQQMDADRDGKITEEEFKAARKRMLDKHDADGDGRLVVDELLPE